jgi:DNA-damage-inducible protein D
MKNETLTSAQKQVRKAEHNGEMYYSVVDIIENLTGTVAPRTYWAMLKKRDMQLTKLSEILKITAADGKIYATEAANKQGILRILTSMPSPEMEPFKTWLSNPKKTKRKAMDLPQIQKIKGYSDESPQNALQVLEPPSPLTREWRERGVSSGIEHALLDATISKWTFDLTPSEHKAFKGLKTEKLQDHLTSLELIFKALGEETTRQFAIKDDAQGFIENYGAAQKGGNLAGDARRNFEKESSTKVVSSANYLDK